MRERLEQFRGRKGRPRRAALVVLVLALAAPLTALMLSSEGSAGSPAEMPEFFRIGDGDDERATAAASAESGGARSDAPAFRLAPNGQIVLGREGLPASYREATVLLQRLNVGEGEPRTVLSRLRRLVGSMRLADLRDLERALEEKIKLLRRNGASSENQLVEHLRGLLRAVRREVASRSGSAGPSARTATASAVSGATRTRAGSGASGRTGTGSRASSGAAGGSPSGGGGGGGSFTRQGSSGGSSGGGGSGSSGGGIRSTGGGGSSGGGGGTSPSGGSPSGGSPSGGSPSGGSPSGGGGGAGAVQAPAPSSSPVPTGGVKGNGRGNSGNGSGNGGGDGNRPGKGGRG